MLIIVEYNVILYHSIALLNSYKNSFERDSID